MDLILRRTKLIKDAIHGELSVNGDLLCFTLERNGVEIPAGRYKLAVYASPAHHCEVPLLLDVPGRSLIEIHTGNWPKDSQGCILVGMVQCSGYIERSRAAFEAVMEKIGTASGVYISVADIV